MKPDELEGMLLQLTVLPPRGDLERQIVGEVRRRPLRAPGDRRSSPALGLLPLAASFLVLAGIFWWIASNNSKTGIGARQGQTEALRKSIRAYLKDKNLESKTEILRLGTAAIRVVYEERLGLKGEAFDDLTDLLFTLRFMEFKDDAHAQPVRVGLATRTFGFHKNLGDHYLCSAIESLTRISCVVDTQSAEVPLDFPEDYHERPAYIELDRLLGARHLDWAYRYGVILISTPARLWPELGEAVRLPDQEQATLRKLVNDLDSDDPRAREESVRKLKGYGQAAIPLLKEVRTSEGKLRAAEALKVIEPLHGEFTWKADCGMDRQRLESGSKQVADRINVDGKSLFPKGHLNLIRAWTRPPQEVPKLVIVVERFAPSTRLDAVLGALFGESGLAVRSPDVLSDMKVAFAAKNISLRNALLLLTKMNGLDFYVEGGRVEVDLKSVVDRKIR